MQENKREDPVRAFLDSVREARFNEARCRRKLQEMDAQCRSITAQMTGMPGGGAYLPLHDAIGHVSLREVGTYPPGIPVVAYGEVITENIADFLKDRDVFGFVNGRLYVTIDK